MGKVINITIRGKIAVYTDDVVYVCGNSDYIIHFDFDAEWNEHEYKTARFITDDGSYTDVVFQGNECAVPVLSNTYKIKVGVFAGNLSTTTPATISAKKSILCGSGTPAAPAEDVYAQLTQMIENGMLRGPQGEPGPQGPQGEPGKDADPYTLPTASATVKGGVKVGPGLEMDGDVLRMATHSYFANSKNYGVGNNENEIAINCKHFRGTIAFIGTTDCSGEACIYCGDKLAGAAPFTAKANVPSIASFRSIMIDGRKYIEVQASDSPNTTFCGEIRRTISSIEEDAAYNKIIVRAISGTMPANSRMMFEWE